MGKHQTNDVVCFFDEKKMDVITGRVGQYLPGSTDTCEVCYYTPVIGADGNPTDMQNLMTVVKKDDALYKSPQEAWSCIIAKTEIRRSYAAKAHLQAEGELIKTTKILRAARKALTALAGKPDLEEDQDIDTNFGRIE